MLRRIIARAPTYIADARQNPQWLLMFAFGRFALVRGALWPKPPDGAATDFAREGSMFSGSIAQAIADLEADGIYTGLMLPKAVTAQIRCFAEQQQCFPNFDRRHGFLPAEHRQAERAVKKPILTGHYLETVEQCATVGEIRADPFINGLAATYLGGPPQQISTRLWWSFPTSGVSEQDLHHASQNKMHFDLDDWRTLKFFFYLTDVGEADGPHVYMRGTHRRRKLRHQFTPVVGHDTAKVIAAYGPENRLTICGRAGSGFAEDPFAFHMGQVSRGRPRLMLELGFGVSSGPKRRFYGDLVLH